MTAAAGPVPKLDLKQSSSDAPGPPIKVRAGSYDDPKTAGGNPAAARTRNPSRSAAKARAGSPFCNRSRPDSRSTRFSQNRRPSGRTSARTRRGGSARAA